ncbi:hypothetical protein FSARC_13319 [Fusarium sarcochroum]|uniref:Uncharacterized protein n=1 Tax=Fusarium sarcochroum TaxID=1208366 RepID=A0A8H4WU19_9HYPO|nr:hypothetical protein FSARC_13319 [Fusarium sarcochroum]
MGAAESKPPRSVSTKKRGGQGSSEAQGSRSPRKTRGGDAPRSEMTLAVPDKSIEVFQQLMEIPFNAEAFLLAKAAQAKALDAEAVSDTGEDTIDNIPEFDQEGTRPYVPTVHAHLKGVDKVCRNGEWSKPLQRFITRLQLGTDTLSVIYDSDLANVGIQPPEESDAWVEQSEPARFASHVYRFLSRQSRSASSDRHYYVLYHPDSDWHADFYDQLQDKPLPSNFLGFSENLDALVAFVKFIRKRLGKRANSAMFHLLIPTSRPMSIRDALEFPDLGDLVIHGETHNGDNYVWVNLPTHESYPANLLLKHAENAIRGESAWKTTATVSTALGGLSASLVGAAFTLRVKGAPFPSLAKFGFAGVCTTIAARVRGAEYLPVAVLGIGGLCTTIAALQVNRALSKSVPRVVGGTEIPREPKAEVEKEDPVVSEQEEIKEDPPKEEVPEETASEDLLGELKPKDDSDNFSIMSKSSGKSSSSKRHRRSERSERSDRKRSHK